MYLQGSILPARIQVARPVSRLRFYAYNVKVPVNANAAKAGPKQVDPDRKGLFHARSAV